MTYSITTLDTDLDVFDGVPGSDAHGNYVVAPLSLFDPIRNGIFLKSQSGELRMIKELDYIFVDGTRCLKIYLQ